MTGFEELTQASDRSTKHAKDWGFRIGHLALHRKLRLDVHIAKESSERGDENSREKEDGSKQDDCTDLGDAAESNVD